MVAAACWPTLISQLEEILSCSESVDVPLYQRVVVIFRTNAELKSPQFDPRRVYLRMFKNVPQQDVDMLLPAMGIQMTWLDHSRIVVPSLYAAGITLWRFLRNVLLLALFGVFKTVAMVCWGCSRLALGLSRCSPTAPTPSAATCST